MARQFARLEGLGCSFAVAGRLVGNEFLGLENIQACQGTALSIDAFCISQCLWTWPLGRILYFSTTLYEGADPTAAQRHQVPEHLKGLFSLSIPESKLRVDISSTAIRARMEAEARGM